jgi:hypothetical protein
MADLVFIQRARLGRTIYRLRGDQLEISEIGVGAQPTNTRALREIFPGYTLTSKRVHWLYGLPLALAVIGFSIFVQLLRTHEEAFHHWMLEIGVFSTLSLAAAIRGFPKVDYFTFYDRKRVPVIQILREDKQSAECDKFVEELVYRIEQITAHRSIAEQPARSHPVSSVRFSFPDNELSLNAGQQFRWAAAISCGVAGVILPLLPRVPGTLLADVVMPAVYLLSFAALCLGYFSFAMRERWRFASLVGMALAFVPAFFH